MIELGLVHNNSDDIVSCQATGMLHEIRVQVLKEDIEHRKFVEYIKQRTLMIPISFTAPSVRRVTMGCLRTSSGRSKPNSIIERVEATPHVSLRSVIAFVIREQFRFCCQIRNCCGSGVSGVGYRIRPMLYPHAVPVLQNVLQPGPPNSSFALSTIVTLRHVSGSVICAGSVRMPAAWSNHA
jgi:hypothetical protein